jgi:hypothetical protein
MVNWSTTVLFDVEIRLANLRDKMLGAAEESDLHPITSPIRYRYPVVHKNGNLSPSPLYSGNFLFSETQRSPYCDTDYIDEVMVHPERPHSQSFGKFNRALSYLAMKAPSTIDALLEEDNVSTTNAWLVLVEPR